MKLSKEELKKKIADSITDEDLAISLLEDIEDSFIEGGSANDEMEKALESAKAEIDDLKRKYKERFLNGDSDSEKAEEKAEDVEELKEEEIIDVKEI